MPMRGGADTGSSRGGEGWRKKGREEWEKG